MIKILLPFAFAISTCFIQTGKESTSDFFQKTSDFNRKQQYFDKYLLTTILDEPFNNLTDNSWTAYSISGSQQWGIISFGSPKPAVSMNGFGNANEDWLISKSIDLASSYTSASFSFQTDGRFTGNPLEVFITADNYVSGESPTTVNWTKLNAVFDDDLASYSGYVPSGNIDLAAYLGKKIRIAFKYKNDLPSSATVWELDNFKVVAGENLSVTNISSEKMKIYPNPVIDNLNFSEDVNSLKITDLSGRIVSEILIKGKSTNISKLKKGVYIIIAKLKSGKTITNKIVKD